MRSGEHELWDAHLVRLGAQARIDALAQAIEPMARALRQLGDSMVVAGERIARAFRQMDEAMIRIGDRLERP